MSFLSFLFFLLLLLFFLILIIFLGLILEEVDKTKIDKQAQIDAATTQPEKK